MAAARASAFSGSIARPAPASSRISGLTFHAENHRARAGHEFQHFGGNDRLEHIGLLQQHKAGVGCGDKRRDLLAGLLIEKSYIGQPSRLRERFDAFFFRAFSDKQKEHIGSFGLESGRGIQQCFQAVSHAHGADIANQKLAIRRRVLF